MKEDRLIQLTTKECLETISGDEKEELSAIVKEERYQKIYSDLIQEWELAGKFQLKNKGDVDKAWSNFQSLVQETKPKSKIYTFRPFLKVAAAILITVSLSLIFFNSWNTQEYETGIGETLEVILEDKSVILLNESSTLSISKVFNEEDRLVQFSGEAYFDIARDTERPFIIESKVSRITVLGTSFNVDARPGVETIQVDVTSGRVSLSEIGKEEDQIFLTEGMRGILDITNRELVSKTYSNENFLSWSSNTLEFKDLKMEEVIEDISKHFNTEITINNEAILNCNFTSTFTQPTIEEVLKVMTLTLDLSYDKSGEEYVLGGKGCTEG